MKAIEESKKSCNSQIENRNIHDSILNIKNNDKIDLRNKFPSNKRYIRYIYLKNKPSNFVEEIYNNLFFSIPFMLFFMIFSSILIQAIIDLIFILDILFIGIYLTKIAS
ncbi:MAG: hypothetical protein ACTSRZ_01740 [Promethearchaeota archaeon]